MPRKKRLLVVDNYKSKNSRAIQQLRESVEKDGYEAKVIRYSDAKTKVDSGKDIQRLPWFCFFWEWKSMEKSRSKRQAGKGISQKQ